MRRPSLTSLSLGLLFLAIKLAKNLHKESQRTSKDTERLKLNRAPSGSQETVVQLNLARKFTVWGLLSIFYLIYSCVLSLTPQGQPM